MYIYVLDLMIRYMVITRVLCVRDVFMYNTDYVIENSVVLKRFFQIQMNRDQGKMCVCNRVRERKNERARCQFNLLYCVDFFCG